MKSMSRADELAQNLNLKELSPSLFTSYTSSPNSTISQWRSWAFEGLNKYGFFFSVIFPHSPSLSPILPLVSLILPLVVLILPLNCIHRQLPSQGVVTAIEFLQSDIRHVCELWVCRVIASLECSLWQTVRICSFNLFFLSLVSFFPILPLVSLILPLFVLILPLDCLATAYSPTPSITSHKV